MKNIGIVGAGIAGLHLGLRLRQHGIATTIYTQYTPEQQRATRLANIVVRSAPTRERERRLGVNHWDAPQTDIKRMSYYVRGQHPLTIHGDLDQPVSIVDLRMYCARLLEDAVQRGCRLVLGAVQAAEIAQLAQQHDLLVVAAGRGHFTTLFPRLPEHSPFDQPQRVVCAGVFHGVAPAHPRSLEIVILPQHGEIIVLPMETFAPDRTGIAFEIIPGGAFDHLRNIRPADDPQHWNATILSLLDEHAPAVAQRIDRSRFALTRPLDQMHTAITPTVRRAYAPMAQGKFTLALGDAHVVNDPLTGQGANNASHTAWLLGDLIRDAEVFDEAFCRRAEQRMWAYTSATTAACLARLQPPPPYIVDLMVAAAQHQPIANAFASGFNHPDHFWHITSSSERTAAFLHQFDHQPEPALLRA